MKVPFNDLSRIHKPLWEGFKQDFEAVLSQGDFVMGSQVEKFENRLAEIERSSYAVTVNSGTSAIELSLRALGIGKGDEVIVPSFTFVASVFAVTQVGATPVLADLEKNSTIISLDSCAKLLTKRTRALILVTLHGRVDNLDLYQEFCVEHNLDFIIDGAQSHLARFKVKPLVDYARAVTLSFYPGKNLGALGEGGAVLTNDKDLELNIKKMRNWGSTKKYHHEVWGGNFRLDTIQASFLMRKLDYIVNWTENRKQKAEIYYEHLPQEILRPRVSSQGDHVYHIFDILVKERLSLIEELKSVGIETGIHYPFAVHQTDFYKHLGIESNCLSESERQASATLSLPLFPKMTEAEQARVIEAISKCRRYLL